MVDQCLELQITLFCLVWTRCVRAEVLLEFWWKVQLECWKVFLPGWLSDEWVLLHDNFTNSVSLPCSFFVSRPIWVLGLGVQRKNCECTPVSPPPPTHTPFRTKSQSKKAVCNANSLKARPCSFLLKVECCPGASWTLRAPCSPLGNFLRAVFSQVEKHLSFRKFQQQLLAFSELLWSAAILQGDVPRRHVGLA